MPNLSEASHITDLHRQIVHWYIAMNMSYICVTAMGRRGYGYVYLVTIAPTQN